jgi:AraC-like DNA-binding protein/mannose-6-phosphate isomerase-like protein (cupin superfamily)
VWGMDSERVGQVLNAGHRHIRGEGVAFSVHYWGADDFHFDNLPHRHSFFEFCHVVEGTGTYREGDAQMPLRPAVSFLSRPGVTHQISSPGGMQLLYVAFELLPEESSPEWAACFSRLAGPSVRMTANDRDGWPSASLWKSVCLAVADPLSAPGEVVQSLALALLASIPSMFGVTAPAKEREGRPTGQTLAERASLFIRDNLGRALSLPEVAAYFHVSERHLSLVLKRATGMGFNRFVRNQRVALAKQLLSQTDTPIKVVAELAGFPTVHYFTTVFAQISGQTPAKYRQEQVQYT